MFFKKVQAAQDPGQWIKHYYEEDPAPGATESKKTFTGIEFKVRRIPPGKKMEIERSRRGGTRKIKVFRTGDSEITRDLDKETAAGIDQAIFALVDSKGCKVQIGDDETAKQYRTLLKDESIQAGQMIVLDGRWTNELREDFLADFIDVASWVVARADEFGRATVEEELGKEKTSPSMPSSV